MNPNFRSTKRITAILKKPNEEPEIISFSNQKETFLKIFGGEYDVCRIDKNTVVLHPHFPATNGFPFNVRLFDRNFLGPILIFGKGGIDYVENRY